MNAPIKPPRAAKVSEPAWDVARLFPDQGAWSEDDYYGLNTNHLVEYSHGYVEFLAMPTQAHQFLVFLLAKLLDAFVTRDGLGTVLVSPLRVRLWEGKFREPDVVFMRSRNDARRGEQYWDGADLVMEVVSDDDRRRDLETKRFEYARAGIPEYWIVDPAHERITVLALDGDAYAVHAEFGVGDSATSATLPGFAVDVAAAFAAARR